MFFFLLMLGGAVLFLYSLAFSRGLDILQMDLKVGAYGIKIVLLIYSSFLLSFSLLFLSHVFLGTTLVVGDFGLCTQALVNLCTIGQALPGLDDEIMERYEGEIEIGMLTFEEVIFFFTYFFVRFFSSS